MEAKLAVVRPDGQAVMPWDDSAVSSALAVPAADLELWRGRQDVIAQPGFVALRMSVRDDPRYHALVRLSGQRGITPEYALGVMLMVTLVALRQERPGLLATLGRPLDIEFVARVWGLPDESLEGFRRAVLALMASGWLVRVDLGEGRAVEAYPRGGSRAVRGRAAPQKREEEGGNVRPRTQVAREAPAGGRAWTPATLAAAITEQLRRSRAERGHAVYPRTSADVSDVQRACRAAIARQRVDELVEVLNQAAGWADDGRGFRKALRDEGFL